MESETATLGAGVLAADLRSDLRVAPDELWRIVSTMDGVNAELRPWMRMTVPREARDRSLAELAESAELAELAEPAVDQPLFSSWLLALGVLPIDRHNLGIRAVWTGGDGRWGFLERSTSWLQARWVHERVIEASARGATVRDRVWISPRIRIVTPLVAAIVRRLFAHRHGVLRGRFA